MRVVDLYVEPRHHRGEPLKRADNPTQAGEFKERDFKERP